MVFGLPKYNVSTWRHWFSSLLPKYQKRTKINKRRKNVPEIQYADWDPEPKSCKEIKVNM